MIKLSIAKLVNGELVIGERNIETDVINNCFKIEIVFLNSQFHYSIKPLIVPFSIGNNIMVDPRNVVYYSDLDLSIYLGLAEEYIKLKRDPPKSSVMH